MMSVDSLIRHVSEQKIQTDIANLRKELESLKNVKKDVSKRYFYDLKCQILIARYLGMLEYNGMRNEDKAKNIQKMFGNVGYENLRILLSKNIDEFVNVKRLIKICQYFKSRSDDANFKKASTDLEALTKKQ